MATTGKRKWQIAVAVCSLILIFSLKFMYLIPQSPTEVDKKDDAGSDLEKEYFEELKKELKAQTAARVTSNDEHTRTAPSDKGTNATFTTRPKALPLIPNECLPYVKKVPGQGNTTKTLLDIKTHGQFIHDPDIQPPYDHTCFLMKPRYNCAVEPGSKMAHDDQAYMWKFVLQSDQNDPHTLCDIGKIVHDLGGPAAVGRKRKVGLLGNSFLRQIFEAIACKYGRTQMTQIRLHVHSPAMSMEETAKRKGRKYALEEYGELASLDPPSSRSNAKCYNMSGFSRIPLDKMTEVIPDCSDNVAVAEYNGKREADSQLDTPTLTIFYHFRSWLLEDPAAMYTQFVGNLTQELDFIGHNDPKQNISSLVPSMLSAQWSNFNDLKPFLESRQRRDAKRWFGANNPWITSPPDGHPCMPGVPDDEAAIILFLVIFELDGFR